MWPGPSLPGVPGRAQCISSLSSTLPLLLSWGLVDAITGTDRVVLKKGGGGCILRSLPVTIPLTHRRIKATLATWELSQGMVCVPSLPEQGWFLDPFAGRGKPLSLADDGLLLTLCSPGDRYLGVAPGDVAHGQIPKLGTGLHYIQSDFDRVNIILEKLYEQHLFEMRPETL